MHLGARNVGAPEDRRVSGPKKMDCSFSDMHRAQRIVCLVGYRGLVAVDALRDRATMRRPAPGSCPTSTPLKASFVRVAEWPTNEAELGTPLRPVKIDCAQGKMGGRSEQVDPAILEVGSNDFHIVALLLVPSVTTCELKTHLMPCLRHTQANHLGAVAGSSSAAATLVIGCIACNVS